MFLLLEVLLDFVDAQDAAVDVLGLPLAALVLAVQHVDLVL